MREIVTDLSDEGQVMIPEEVREYLGLGTRGRVAFIITDEGTVQLQPPHAEIIETLRGAAGSLDRHLSWARIDEIAREDQVDLVVNTPGDSHRR